MARPWQRLLLASFLGILGALWLTATQAAEPIRIGFSMALTGGLAGTGKAALLASQIWAEDVNAAGGLLGRPVELVYDDDQSSGATVPGIHSKLLDVDRVDLIVSGYATNMVAPAVPIAMQHGMVLMSLFGLAVNAQFHYDRYFQIVPSGDDPEIEFSTRISRPRREHEPAAADGGDRRRRCRVRPHRHGGRAQECRTARARGRL